MIVLMPCYSLEDFSIYRNSRDSNQILAAWTALYHPALICHFDKMPSWDRAGNPMPGKSRKLVVIPPCVESQVPRDWKKELEESDAVVIRNIEGREGIVQTALKELGVDTEPFSDDAAASFFSLGFCHFMSELYSRKLRYMSNLDTQRFTEKSIEAAKALAVGNDKEYSESLRRAFEILTEAKEYFFPTAMNLIDLTQLEPGDMAERLPNMLRRRAERGETTNLVLPTFFLNKLQTEFPEVFELLKSEVQSGRVAIAGGDRDESPLYLMPPVEIANRLVEGWLDYFDAFGMRPSVFARNTAGYTQILPQMLSLTGCDRALLFAKDGWQLTREAQSRIDWRDPSGTLVRGLSRFPVSAAEGKVFLEMPDRVGYSASGDHALSTIFAHAPSTELPWLGDLARMARFAPVLGNVPKLPDFFKETTRQSVPRTYGKDDFRANFLTRAGQDMRLNPVSSWSIFYLLEARMRALTTLALSAALVSPERAWTGLPGFAEIAGKSEILEELKADTTDQLCQPIRLALDGIDDEDERKRISAEIEEQQKSRIARIAEKLAKSRELLAGELGRAFAELHYSATKSACTTGGAGNDTGKQDTENTEAGAGEGNAPGDYYVNMSPVPKDYYAATAYYSDAETEGFVDTRTMFGHRCVRVSVPAFSALWLKRNDTPPLAEPASVLPKGIFKRLVSRVCGEQSGTDTVMAEFRTERFADGVAERFCVVHARYFEIKIDTDTGAVRSVRTQGGPQMSARRGLLNQPAMGNRISWHVAMKLSKKRTAGDSRPENSGHRGYSIMSAEKVEMLENTPFRARVLVVGGLVAPDGERLADYREVLDIRRNSRVIGVELTIDPRKGAFPSEGCWDEYYGVRFAWSDRLAEVRVGCHGEIWDTDRNYIQAPELVDIRSEENVGVTLLNGGLPFYRRYGDRKMDAILVPRGESGRVFRFAVGLDLDDPLAEAARFMSPDPLVLEGVPCPGRVFGRFLETGEPNVAAIYVEPCSASREEEGNQSENQTEGESAGTKSGKPSESDRIVGFRLVLQETAGKKTECRIQCAFPIKTAVETNLLWETGNEVKPSGSRELSVKLSGHQILPLEIRLADSEEDSGQSGEGRSEEGNA